jgi:hypothetical protein
LKNAPSASVAVTQRSFIVTGSIDISLIIEVERSNITNMFTGSRSASAEPRPHAASSETDASGSTVEPSGTSMTPPPRPAEPPVLGTEVLPAEPPLPVEPALPAPTEPPLPPFGNCVVSTPVSLPQA